MADTRVYFGDDFGQKIDLTVRIREILRNYPEGTSIFKEMVQNADDAGATEVAFCFDLRHHPTEGLAYPKLAEFQGLIVDRTVGAWFGAVGAQVALVGPSLLAFNNSIFTGADFQSIQRIGDSLKKDHSKGWKTGRFGVGFNSVYHLTDLPAFVSGSHLVYFDPQACHLPNVNPSNPGKIIDFIAHPELVNEFPAQVAPFRVFGCDFSTPFKGTLFRLALRSKEQASKSRLSSREQTPAHMLEMLQEFADSTDLTLLFLRNVTDIKILRWDHGADEPSLVCHTSIANITEDVRAKRSLKNSIVDFNSSTSRQFDLKGHICDYQVEVLVANAGCDPTVIRYLVTNQLGGGECSQIANDPANADQRLVPWGGVAVNGYFELSSNRRDIWFGDGLSGDGLVRAQWNQALLQYVIAPCYARAIMALTDSNIMKPHSHANLFPRQVPPQPWDALARSVLTIIQTQKCLFSEAKGGVWVSPADAMIVRRTSENYENLVKWLLEDDVPVVTTLSEDVENVLVKSRTVPGFLPPEVLRSQYKNQSSRHVGNQAALKTILGFLVRDLDGTTLAELSGVGLLPLCDNSLTTFCEPARGDEAAWVDSLCSMGFQRLHVLRALQMTRRQSAEDALNWLVSHPTVDAPCADDDCLEHKMYFLANDEERWILSRANSRLVDTNALPSYLLKLLASNSGGERLNVRAIDMEGFEDLLSLVFPHDWYGKQCVSWKSDDEAYSTFSEDWIRRFWRYLGPSRHLRSLQDKWPILPTESGLLCSLSAASGVVTPELLPGICATALNKVGVPLLLKNLFAAVQPHTDIWNYVHQPTPAGVLASLASLSDGLELEIKKRFRTVTNHEREHLRQFLLADDGDDLDSTCKIVLANIPIFRGVVPAVDIVEYDVMWTESSEEGKQRCGHCPVFVGIHAPRGVSRLVCPGIEWRFLPDRFVCVSDDDASMIRALSHLSVPIMTKANFLRKFLIPRVGDMPVEFRIDFICYLLRELSTWLEEDRTGDLIRLIETEPLFPAMNGELKRVGDHFDPEIDEFSKIMDGSFYPAIELQEPQPLSTLRSLGLQRHLSRRSVLSLACSIDADQTKLCLAS